MLDARFVRLREARAPAAGDAAELEEAQFVPEGEVCEVIFDGPAVDVGPGHLVFRQPGDGFVDAIAGGVHLDEELVAGRDGSHCLETTTLRDADGVRLEFQQSPFVLDLSPGLQG